MRDGPQRAGAAHYLADPELLFTYSRGNRELAILSAYTMKVETSLTTGHTPKVRCASFWRLLDHSTEVESWHSTVNDRGFNFYFLMVLFSCKPL